MSPSQNNCPSFRGKPIRQLTSLAKALGCTDSKLMYVSGHANNLYRVAQEVPKSDGTVRHTFDAKPLLKDLQRRIKKEILDRVIFPDYLTGSIKGRDYKSNAALHQGAKIVISEDIGNFFPSTSYERVYDVWRGFFRFSEEVAEVLTLLTMRNGELPQGAITSPHLANLVFWRNEPKLQSALAATGATYSRFVDDISVSSKETISAEQKTKIIAAIYGLIQRNGYKPKRRKHELTTAKLRMAVTKLTVNVKPSLPKDERSKIRASVHHLELMKQGKVEGNWTDEVHRVQGKVNHLARFHPGEAAPLKVRLAKLQDG